MDRFHSPHRGGPLAADSENLGEILQGQNSKDGLKRVAIEAHRRRALHGEQPLLFLLVCLVSCCHSRLSARACAFAAAVRRNAWREHSRGELRAESRKIGGEMRKIQAARLTSRSAARCGRARRRRAWPRQQRGGRAAPWWTASSRLAQAPSATALVARQCGRLGRADERCGVGKGGVRLVGLCVTAVPLVCGRRGSGAAAPCLASLRQSARNLTPVCPAALSAATVPSHCSSGPPR